jgi:hypothetical protein
MKVSKKEFINNVSEWVWEGNGRCDLEGDNSAYIPEPVCSTYTRWLTEWLTLFNTLNPDFQLKLNCDISGYRLVHNKSKIVYPKVNNIEDEEYELTTKEAENAYEITKESRIDEDSDEESDD